MYGHMLLGLTGFVQHTYGEEAWRNSCLSAGVDPEECFFTYDTYDDSIFYRLVDAVVANIEVDVDTLLFDFGYYTFSVSWHHSKHDTLLYGLGADLCELMQSLNALHHHLSSKYTKMIAPSFSCEITSECLLVHYHSCRPKLGQYVKGIIHGVARHMYRLNVSVDILDYEDLGSEVTLRYYYKLEVCLKGESDRNSLTRLQGTGKNGGAGRNMKGINVATFHVASPSKNDDDDPGESVVAPDEDWPITVELFNVIAPFHLIFDSQLNIISMGNSFVKLLAHNVCHEQLSLMNLFNIELPTIAPTYRNIRKEFAGLFILSLKDGILPSRGKQPAFRGQMSPVTSCADSPILFISSPSANTFEEMERMGFSITDIGKTNPLHELLENNNYYNPKMDLSRQLEKAKHQLEVKKADVELAKAHTDKLLQCMLPIQVAYDLKANGYVVPREFSQVSVLFTSISNFQVICKNNSPLDIVVLLNGLFTRFDCLVEIHQVYKVETVADSYMMTAGFPDTAERHAEAVTNMAFDMRRAVTEMNKEGVHKDKDKDRLEIVIGIHSGPVVTGVVGTRLPRYCLFGDTVNTASRMNSTGQVGKIHISESTYEHIREGDTYHFVNRGMIPVKGLGLRTTYFVEDRVSSNDIGNGTLLRL